MSNPQPPHGQQPPGQPYPGTPPQGQPYPGTPPQGQPQGQPYPGTPPQGQQYGTPPQGQQYGTPPQGQQYPGTPPQGQPYGAPQGQPYGGPPPQGGFGQQPPPPGQPYPGAPGDGGAPKKSSSKVVRAVVVIAVLVAAGIGGFFYFTKSAATAEAGDCIKVNSASETDADVEKIDCSDPTAVFKVGTKLDSSSGSCPDGDYLSYTQSGRGSGFTLCLVYNVAKGECLAEPDDAEKARKVACGGPDVEVEVLDVQQGKTNSDDCQAVEGATAGIAYSEPAMIICAKAV